MKKSFLVLALAITLTSATLEPDTFTGEIQYKYSFTDLEGNDVTGTRAQELGMEQHYFVSDSAYKSYDESNNITQLYDSRNNIYYGFWKDKTSRQIDALYRSSQQFIITKLDKKEKILGYDCESIRVETDNASTLYYYSPKLRIDRKAFGKHNFGDWNSYLQATNGALSLKYVITYPKEGYVWTIIAQKVTPMKLSGRDFSYPQGYALKN